MHIHVHIYETVYVYVFCFLLVPFFCRINTSMLRYLSALYFLKVDTHCNKLDMMVGGEISYNDDTEPNTEFDIFGSPSSGWSPVAQMTGLSHSGDCFAHQVRLRRFLCELHPELPEVNLLITKQWSRHIQCALCPSLQIVRGKKNPRKMRECMKEASDTLPKMRPEIKPLAIMN